MRSHRCPVTRLLVVSDVVFAVTSPFAALSIRNVFEAGVGVEDTFLVYALSSAVATLALLCGMGCCKASWRFYSSSDALHASRAIALGIAIGVVTSFAHDRLLCVARTVPFVQVALQVASVVGARLIARALSGVDCKHDDKPEQVLVVGCNSMSLTYLHAVRGLTGCAISVAGFLTEDATLVGQTIRGKPVVGTIDAASDAIATLQVHGINVATLVLAPGRKGFSSSEIRALDAARERYALSITDVPCALSALMVVPSVTEPKSVHALAARKPFYGLLKRTIDVAGSVLLLLVVAPLMPLVCAVVAVDVGFPVLFWQQRLGKDGKRLTVYKFRTMRSPFDAAGRRIPDAKRVSVIGRWLRKMRIDELPQLISVLRGDMSFVGPRPLLPIDQPLDASRRLAVKPGLTGWAQVHGGNLVAIEDKNALDLWYVAHSSLWLDLQIGMRTILMVLRGDSLNDGRIEQAKSWMDGLDFAAGT